MDILKFILEKILFVIAIALKYLNEYKIIIYPIFFIIYFYMYYSMVMPQLFFSLDPAMMQKINKIFVNKACKISALVFNILLFVGFFAVIILLKFVFKDKYENYYVYLLMIFIILFNFIIIITVIANNEKIGEISNKKSMRIGFYVVSSFFYIIFITLFVYSAIKPNSTFAELYPFDEKSLEHIDFFNTEFMLSFLIIFLFFIQYAVFTGLSFKSMFYKLDNYDSAYLTLTTQCLAGSKPEPFDDTIQEESYDNPSSTALSDPMFQINNILKKYGDKYLLTIDNIPISFYNKKLSGYQDLTISDFYYPGSYYTYTAATPLNAIPSLTSIKTAMNTYKVRIIHLDVFANIDTNEPIVKSATMKPGAQSLNFLDCLNTINDLAWVNENSKYNHPIFLYLNFSFESNETTYIKIFEYLMRVFSTKLMDKKYSFSGRNGAFKISQATIKEALNKVILITNIYPTYSVLDELINSSSNSLNNDVNFEVYKKYYITNPYPDGTGLSHDHEKDTLLLNTQKNLYFFYTVPNANHANAEQMKAGLYNPNFFDCAQYGIQSTLMFLYTPDKNFKEWNDFFQTTSNFQPVLKDEILRPLNSKAAVIQEQDPRLVLSKPTTNDIATTPDGKSIITSEK